MMLYKGSAYGQPALAPVSSVTTLAPSRSAAAAAVSQNQSDIHLYLVLVAAETSVAAVVFAQKVTTPPASKQTASVN